MLSYVTSTGDQRPGWDAFDRMVLWAVGTAPRTLDEIAGRLPAGIAFHLIDRTLRDLAAEGALMRVVGSGVRYQRATTVQPRQPIGFAQAA